MPAVIDTNVLIAANGRNTHADPECQIACIEEIQRLIRSVGNSPIAIDDRGLILEEYKRYLNFHGQPGVGDLFYKFLNDEMHTNNSVIAVSINACADISRGFDELPVNNLDHSDRKFLAVAVVSGSDILNATDSDWHENTETLNGLGIRIKQLCPQHANRGK